VNKKEIFLLAARELKLNIQEEKTIEINDDMYLTKIKIGKVLCRDPVTMKQKSSLESQHLQRTCPFRMHIALRWHISRPKEWSL